MTERFEEHEAYMADPPKSSRSVLTARSLRRPLKELDLREPLCVDADQPVATAIVAMRENRVGSVLVTRGGKLVGIFTERDVLNRLALGEHDPKRVALKSVMRRDPETLTASAPMAYALNRMSQGGFRHVPLVDEHGRPTGTVSVRDIVDYLVNHFPDEILTTPPKPEVEFARSREGA